MAKTPQISDAEWLVMRALWAQSPMTATEVCEALGRENDWKVSTVKTLLGRLVDKGALEYLARGREYLYSPAVKEADAIRTEAGSFVDRIFGGAVAPMLAHFMEEHKLSTAEIAHLKAMLDAAHEKNNQKKEKKP